MPKGKFVTPETYFVGATAANFDELLRYLEDTDQMEFWQAIQDAKAEGLSDGEVLVSYYAKLCYAALTTKKNENISQVRNIHDNLIGTIKSGHGCYDALTEVLTADGWKFWPDVVETDRLMTLDTKAGVCRFQLPKRLVGYEHSGRMVRVDSVSVDLLVTPDHKMWACKTTTKEGRRKNDYALIRADDLVGRSHAYMKGLPGGEVAGDFAPEWQLLGFAIGDAYGDGRRLTFRLRKTRKINYLHRLAQQLDLEVKPTGEDRYAINIPVDHPLPWSPRDIYTEDGVKIIPPSLLAAWTDTSDQTAARSVIDGLMNSDGCSTADGDLYDTTSELLAGQIQWVGVLCGLPVNISQAECYKDRSRSYGDKPMYRLYFIRKNHKPQVDKFSASAGKSSFVDNWEGEVFCAEVPEFNVLYVRRNGKTVWSGNSVFEHCYLNFTVANCSRVFTHELVRHRVGTSFSQTSGRYVRSEALNLVIDPILDPINVEIMDLQAVLEGWYEAAVEKMGLNKLNIPFDRKRRSRPRSAA